MIILNSDVNNSNNSVFLQNINEISADSEIINSGFISQSSISNGEFNIIFGGNLLGLDIKDFSSDALLSS